MLFFTSSRDHIALRAKSYKESSRVCKYILKEFFSPENFEDVYVFGKFGFAYANPIWWKIGLPGRKGGLPGRKDAGGGVENRYSDAY
jgi:hypothetical protein